MQNPSTRTCTLTGYHLLCAKFELREEFNMFDDDVQPLDAPELIAAGSTLSFDSPRATSIQRGNFREQG